MFETNFSPSVARTLEPPAAADIAGPPLLDVSGLNVVFPSASGDVRVSEDVRLDIGAGDSLCLVGESGCGKTMAALAVMRLLPPQARISGKIGFKGRNILDLDPGEMRAIRGREIAMIFEQPASCLNPVFKVGRQIAEAVRIHLACSRREARDRAIELMAGMGLRNPEKLYGRYPHEFSGGMAQRAMIAMALAFNPSLLIADEPTTSLDVTIQAQIIDLLQGLVEKFNTSLLLITHDLAAASRLCSRVAVMYAGGIVETGRLDEVFSRPRHPYTKALAGAARGDDTSLVSGTVPELSRLPDGCRFHPRCPQARDICRTVRPSLENGLRCHLDNS